ncbi:hypothetical protein BJX68DRAFT_223107 [Aspergillus pseudodeflectus]|uniref:Uncharacterized protein n=1 Tax=Aspergillus pseudodeflectus TaxID=176178 RepID=A0ABR4LBH2_9EURO
MTKLAIDIYVARNEACYAGLAFLTLAMAEATGRDFHGNIEELSRVLPDSLRGTFSKTHQSHHCDCRGQAKRGLRHGPVCRQTYWTIFPIRDTP